MILKTGKNTRSMGAILVDILPATTNDSYVYQQELNSFRWMQVRYLNHRATAAHFGGGVGGDGGGSYH